MPETTIAGAAALLGVSTDTVRRRIRTGRLSARQDEKGWWLVEVPESVDGQPLRLAEPVTLTNELVQVQRELAQAQQEAVLARLSAEVTQLRGELEAQRRLDAEKQRHLDDLRTERDRLWDALQQAQRLLAPPQEARMPPQSPPEQVAEPGRGKSRWRAPWRR